MKILNHSIRILVGLVFVFSGLTKLFPIEPFEIIFIDLGVSNWLLAPFVARFIIAFEIFLGLCLIFDVWLKNIIYNLTHASLIVFTGYLFYLLFTKGNATDCGCFGSYLVLTPVQSIIKNIVLIVLLLIVKRRYHAWGLWWLAILFLAVAFTSTFLLNRVGLQNAQGIELNEKIDYSAFPPLYKTDTLVDFSKGKKLVVFLSVKCPHCESAAHKLSYLNTERKVGNLYIILASREENRIQPFLDKTKLDYPMIWFNDDIFFKYSGGSLPAFVYLEDGVLKKKWTGEFFKVEEIEALLTD